MGEQHQWRRNFSEEEIASLARGISIFGEGKWREIRGNFRCHQSRTNVSLKDLNRSIKNYWWRDSLFYSESKQRKMEGGSDDQNL